MEKQYRLIFKGELLAGFDPAAVRKRASQRLGTSPAQLERLFCGQAVTLKRGLRIDAAARYARELRLLGMRMHVELDSTSPLKADLPAGHCKIVFSGELAEGRAREEVMEAAAERLHATPAQLALLFSGRTTTLKKGLGEEQARRYASRLQAIGMLVSVEMQEPAGGAAATSAPRSKPVVPAMVQDAGFSHVDTLIHSPLMQASDRLHAVAPSAPVDLDFTQTMVDNELVATNAQQVVSDMEKTELAGEAALREYMHEAPSAATLPAPVIAMPMPSPAIPAAAGIAVIAPPPAATEFVHAANVAPIGPKRVCAGCGARQTHGRHCAHCGLEFPREVPEQTAVVMPSREALPQTLMVTEADPRAERKTPSRRIAYIAVAATLASLSLVAWRLTH